MSDKAKLQSTIKMLESGLKSPATPPAFRAKLQSELDKAKKSLEDLEAAEKAQKKADTPSEKKTATKRRSRAEKKVKDVTTQAKNTVKKAKEAKPAKSEKRRERKTKSGGTSQAKSRQVARENRERQRLSTSKYDIERDANRPALKAGKRVSASGNVYYENRENRIDRRPKKYARLDEGGEMAEGGRVPKNVKKRLEEIRKAIREENISYGEIAELQSLKKYIDPSDVELLQWANDNEEYDESGGEMAFGGRAKSGLMRDRAYKSDEPHEQAYSRKRRPKNPKYKKAEEGMEMAKGGKVTYDSLYPKIVTAVMKEIRGSKEEAEAVVDNYKTFIIDIIEFQGVKSPSEIADAITSDYGEQYNAGGEMAKGGSIRDFKYEIYAENTKTGEKNTVAYVKAYGDIPLIITGLQKGVTSSPIKYGFKEIKKSMEHGGEMHRSQDGMYKKGGTLTSKANYLSQRDIESLTTWDGVVIDGSDLMDGVYVKKRVKI